MKTLFLTLFLFTVNQCINYSDFIVEIMAVEETDPENLSKK